MSDPEDDKNEDDPVEDELSSDFEPRPKGRSVPTGINFCELEIKEVKAPIPFYILFKLL